MEYNHQNISISTVNSGKVDIWQSDAEKDIYKFINILMNFVFIETTLSLASFCLFAQNNNTYFNNLSDLCKAC